MKNQNVVLKMRTTEKVELDRWNLWRRRLKEACGSLAQDEWEIEIKRSMEGYRSEAETKEGRALGRGGEERSWLTVVIVGAGAFSWCA